MLSQRGFRGPLTPLGKYLRERGYILPKGTHEYRQFQFLFGQQHYRSDKFELILLASEDCNLRCKYCYDGCSPLIIQDNLWPVRVLNAFLALEL